MPNSQLLGATTQLAGACGCPRSPQLCARSRSALRAHDAARPSISATPRQVAEGQHPSTGPSTGLEISRQHSVSERASCREGPKADSSQGTWELSQLEQDHIRNPGRGREAAPAGLWCWEWCSIRWRASFFFLMASVAFVVGSAASLRHHMFAGVSLTVQEPIVSSSNSPVGKVQLFGSQARRMPGSSRSRQ